MNNQQILNLKKFVANFPERLASTEYYDNHLDCGCVVGHMLLDLGVAKENLCFLGDYVDDWYDDRTRTESNELLVNSMLNTAVASKTLVEKYGLSPDQFRALQRFNDSFFNSEEERAIAVKEYLKSIIEKNLVAAE